MCVTKFGYKNGNSVAATFRAFRVCDFFLWGYAKDQVYANNPKNLEQLKTNLREVMAEILPQMCRKCAAISLEISLEELRPVRGSEEDI